MSKKTEYYITADKILTEDGLCDNKALFVIDGIVSSIHNSSAVPDSTALKNFSGFVLTPLLCDHHLHLFNNGVPVKDGLSDLIAHGIAKAYDGGDKNIASFMGKEIIGSKLDLKMSGCAIYREGGYGNHIGMGVKNVDETKELIEWLIHFDADYMKLINSGIFRPETGKITSGGFKPDELKEIVSYAGVKGLEVACHANGDRAIREAIESGVSSIIHGLGVSDETLSLMSERGVNLIPTVNAFMNLKEISSDRGAIRNIEEAVENHLSTIKKASEKGINILPGSDSGPSFIPYGKAFHQELSLFHRSGLSIEQILSSAAISPFKEGMKAEFVVMEGIRFKKVVSEPVS